MTRQKVTDNTYFRNAVEKLQELGKVGLKQQDLADQIGTDKGNISKIMSDQKAPSKTVLGQMVNIYGISLQYLKKGVGPMFIKDKNTDSDKLTHEQKEVDRLKELLVATKELARSKEELLRTKEKVARKHEKNRNEWQRWATDSILRNEAYLKALLIRVSEIHAHLNNLATDDVVAESESDAEDIFLQLKKQLPAAL